MLKGIKYPTSRISTNIAREGESIEEFLRKATKGGEPIQATARVTYNDRKEGVLPQHDIRTDRFDIALMATDKIHATQAAQRHLADFPIPLDENGKPIPSGGEA